MNFFQQQDHARRQTRKLVMLFFLAVIAIVIAVNVAMMCIAQWTNMSTGRAVAGLHDYPNGFFLANTLITLALILGGTMIELFNLRNGGDAVARMAGGRQVATDTRDSREKRLLNVVEEMALASGIACPKVYLLDQEESINAFAAGYQINEAVIAVTRGTLDRLKRDELQGVVAHEFSHILNGDMRLNVRLIGVLFGIQMLSGFGRNLMQYGGGQVSDRNKSFLMYSMPWLAGLALYLIGYIGIFFGRLIKSAVSRQREFLADASAVQFTRNADGIGQALRKIGGLIEHGGSAAQIRHPNAEHLSHLFLNAAMPKLSTGWFATHPPISERLRRIYGRHVDVLDDVGFEGDSDFAEVAEPALPDIPYAVAGFADAGKYLQSASDDIIANAARTAKVNGGGAPLQPIRLDSHVEQAIHDPATVSAIVYALLLTQPQQQCEILRQHAPAQLQITERLAKSIAQLPSHVRLPLIDLSAPALRRLSQDARAELFANVDRLIEADRRITLFEFVLETVLVRRLSPRAGRATPVRYSSLQALRNECAILFSLTAHVAAPLLQQSPAVLFARIGAHHPQLGLGEPQLLDARQLGFVKVKAALDRANQLAPLAKPALIKSLVAVMDAHAPLPMELADLLRAVCAALDAPMPPTVAAAYELPGWPEAA